MCAFIGVMQNGCMPLPLVFATPSEGQRVGLWRGAPIKVVALAASENTMTTLAGGFIGQGDTFTSEENYRAIIITEADTWYIIHESGTVTENKVESVWTPGATSYGLNFPLGYPGVNHRSEEGGVVLSLMTRALHIRSPIDFFSHFKPMQSTPSSFGERALGFFRKFYHP